MKAFTLITIFFLSWNLWAAEHREHGSHEHGSAVLSIAFEDSQDKGSVTGRVEFKAAAQGILGFEHAAKSDKDKKILTEAVTDFATKISSRIQMDPKLNCQFTQDRVGMLVEKGHSGSGQHRDFAANFHVRCAKSPLGTVLVLDFTDLKKIKDIDVTVLVGNLQKSAELKMKPVQLELK